MPEHFWNHKTRKLPDRMQARAKELLRAVMYAESEVAAETGLTLVYKLVSSAQQR